MKRILIGAALAAAVLFAVFEPPAAAAQQVYAIERSEIQPGANRLILQAPSAEPSAQYENTAELTQFQADGEVGIPWGDWVGALLDSLFAVIFAFALWLLRKVPKHVIDFFDSIARMSGQGSANELLEKAIGYGINTTAGAVRGKTLTVAIGNEVLERAVEYAVRHAPGLVGKIGGFAGVREKIIARLDLEAEAAIPSPRPPAESLITAGAPAGP